MEESLEGDGGEGEAPLCLICGEQLLCVKNEGWTEEQKEILQYFQKWVYNQEPKGKRKKQPVQLGWREMEEAFPLCGECQGDLAILVELQSNLRELEERIRQGELRIKERMNARMKEESFDARIGRLRSQILQLSTTPRKTKDKTHQLPKRKSTRRKAAPQVDPLLEEEPEPPSPQFGEDPAWDADSDFEAPGEVEMKPDIDSLANQEFLEIPIATQFDNTTRSDHDNSRRSRRSAALKRGLSYHEDDDDGGGGGDEDFVPYKKPPSRKKPSPPKPKPTPRKLKEKDPEWGTDVKDLLSGAEEDEEDEDNAQSDSDIDEDSGKRKVHHLVKDPSTGIISFRGLTFVPILDSDTMSTSLQCSECQKLVENKNNSLKRHYIVAHTSRFECPYCERRFDNRSKLREHVHVKHEGGTPRPHKKKPCPICGKPSYINHLVGHMWSHKSPEEKEEAMASGDPNLIPADMRKTHICADCGKNFRNLTNYKSHLKTHQDPEEREELCPECGGTFKDLKGHMMRVHEDVRPNVPCTEPGCGKSFRTVAVRNKHRNAVHKKLTPFKCPECPREFGNKMSLKHHVNLHQGIRPWQCPYCELAFGRKSHLQRHVQNYHTGGAQPRRKGYVRGVTSLQNGKTKRELLEEGKYLPPSALATWAQGREPTSHFPKDVGQFENAEEGS